MKFCPVVPEICRGQVHGPRKERKRIIIIIIIIIIIRRRRRNGAKTISLQTLLGRLNKMAVICVSFRQERDVRPVFVKSNLDSQCSYNANS